MKNHNLARGVALFFHETKVLVIVVLLETGNS